jgi:hypothetical protein
LEVEVSPEALTQAAESTLFFPGSSDQRMSEDGERVGGEKQKTPSESGRPEQ